MPRDFDKLWLGQSVSELGSHFTSTGLPLTAILVVGARPAEMGLLAAFGALGVIAAAPLAGVWLDRLPRRRVLIGADLGRALALCAVPALAFSHALRAEHLYLVAFIIAALGTFFEVGYRSMLPALVPRDELVRANGRLATTSSVAEVGGPATAGAFVQALSAPVALLVDAASFVVSASRSRSSVPRARRHGSSGAARSPKRARASARRSRSPSCARSSSARSASASSGT